MQGGGEFRAKVPGAPGREAERVSPMFTSPMPSLLTLTQSCCQSMPGLAVISPGSTPRLPAPH